MHALFGGNRLTVLALLITSLLMPPATAQEDAAGAGPFAFEVGEINPGLPPAAPPLRLDTPRAALESYLAAVRRKDFLQAAHALNLDALPPAQQAERAPSLAQMLAFVLRRHDLVNWSEIPDQPDARVIPPLQQSGSPYSRRSVQLGEVELDGRPVAISLRRFRSGDGEPVWLFSPFAVERIPAIYAASTPVFVDWLPLEDRLDTLGQPSLMEWAGAAALLLAACGIWIAAHRLVRAVAGRLPPRLTLPGQRAALPFATAVAAGAFILAAKHLFLLTGPVASNLELVAEGVALGAAAWLLIRVLSALSRALSEHYVVPLSADDPENRRTKTTVYVVRCVSLVVIALLSLAYILVRTGIFQSYGLSMLASAGVLGVLVAVAARPLLSNMVAGLQIALTDPVRIGDVVLYDDRWATVEDISFAHTVLRTWTDTRLIVPHADFLSRPFENWSKEGEAVWRIVKLPVDYRIDLARIRRRVHAVVDADPRSAEPPRVEMAEADADVVVVWIWVCGTTAETCWTLHNEVRERLVAFLKELDDGAYLPRRRHVLVATGDGAEPVAATGRDGT